MEVVIPGETPSTPADLHRWLLEAFSQFGDANGGWLIRGVDIGSDGTEIAHGLHQVPRTVLVLPYDRALVYRSEPPTERALFLATEPTEFISTFSGRNGAGACALTGATIGDAVDVLVGVTGVSGNGATNFESVITATNDIQQSSASNLSGNQYWVRLLRSRTIQADLVVIP